MNAKAKKIFSYIRPLILLGAVLLLKPYILPYVIPAATPDVTYAGGFYLDYDEVNIPTEGETVLFFHADRCPSCVRAEKNFKASGIPSGLTILKVDYDSHKDLREQYGIRSQTSYVHVRPDGSPISVWVGSFSIANILAHIEQNNKE